MPNQMLSDAEWSRNVGTQAFPVSFLHEYAVGLLWDRLQGSDPVLVTTMDGALSRDLKQGVYQVVIPDSMQPIGGCIPDLALLDADLRPVRVIEVVVTSPPTAEKLEKLKRLEERGVEVVMVPVRNERELKGLVPADAEFERINWANAWRDIRGGSQLRYDGTVGTLIEALIHCTPQVRRRFARILDELDNLESLFPLSPNNPKSRGPDNGAGKE